LSLHNAAVEAAVGRIATTSGCLNIMLAWVYTVLVRSVVGSELRAQSDTLQPSVVAFACGVSVGKATVELSVVPFRFGETYSVSS